MKAITNEINLDDKKTVKGHAEENKYLSSSLEILSACSNYTQWVYQSIEPYIGKNILEIGSGIGNITQYLVNKGRLTCIDVNPNYVNYLLKKFHSEKKEGLQAYPADITNIEGTVLKRGSYDTVICLNVLEHIQEDQRAFENMVHLLAPQGHLIIMVPAFQSLYGPIDKALAHYKRYTKKDFRKFLSKLPLKMKQFYYMNFIGFFGWFLYGRILKRQFLPKHESKLFDRLVPFLSRTERIFHLPLGQSLFFIAQKEEADTNN